MSKLPIIKEDNIANYIYFIRGEKVMLDADIVSCTQALPPVDKAPKQLLLTGR